MAEIRIIGNIENVETVNRFKPEDLALIPTKNKRNNFGLSQDYIEYFVYDAGGNLLNIDYSYTDFKSSPNVGLDENGTVTFIEIDPVSDIQDLGYSSGEVITQYNFFRRKISNESQEGLFIKEISADRTELRIASTVLTNEEIESLTLSLIEEVNSADYFKTYLANFGANLQYVVINIALNKNIEQYEIFLKLYEPLSENITEKSTFWLVDEVIEPYVFNINLDRLVIPDPLPQLGGPNFNIELPDKNTVITQYQNYRELISNTSGSTYQQFLSFITSRSIDINVDYTDLNNFIKFSSATKRVQIFYDKIEEIQLYQTQINSYTSSISTTSSLASEINRLSSSINDIIANFDGFEYYLYFESGSNSSNTYLIKPYPKTNTSKPYILSAVNSLSASAWYSSSLEIATLYDSQNLDNLENVVPLYIREDDNNTPYLTFVNMVGHYFDNIWIYIKSVTDLYKSYNNLESGISKDLVYYALNSLGFKTYNSKEDAALLDYIIGQNSGSANFDNNFTATGSFLNNIPRQDLVAETYKRIYHNISLLFKSKGSKKGIDYLSNIFGVTSSILELKEYGGITKNEYLKGFSDNKIRISNQTITGSLLSPFIGLEQKVTASREFLNVDYHKVDIGFSPQNQIDKVISSSLGNFNIDDYIGDPAFAYSSSYSTLETIKQTTFTSSFDYQFDYSGFIRLIKFFDNTLFKTFKDFSPIRNNTSTGVIIRSPQLERNKIKQIQPNTSYHVVQEASYSIADISEDKSYLWSLLADDRKPFYTGELITTMSSVNDYFENTFPNPYLITTSSVILPSITGSNVFSFQDSNIFEHTDFNVTLNNVSSSRSSILRKVLEPIYSGSNLKINSYISNYFAELQDTNESLRTYQLSRYEGVKTKSLLYNTYTPETGSYTGDESFGKTTAIDKHVKKIGLYSQIVESIYLPNRNNVRLKYLVDKDGNLTELNQRNRHWEEVQRTFIAGDEADISLFDNQKYGNQKITDGIKPIFDSGYSYYPVLFFGACSGSREPILYFENLGGASSYGVVATNGSASYAPYIQGATPIGYPTSNATSNGLIKNIFDNVVEGGTYLDGGTVSTYPTYTAPEAGQYRIKATFTMTITIPDNQETTWSLQVYKNGSTLLREDEEIITSYTGSEGGGGSWTPINVKASNMYSNTCSSTTTVTVYMSSTYSGLEDGAVVYKNKTLSIPFTEYQYIVDNIGGGYIYAVDGVTGTLSQQLDAC